MIYASKFKKHKEASNVIYDPIDFSTQSSAHKINQLVKKIDKLPDSQGLNDSVINFEACIEVDIDKMLALKLMKVEQF